MMRHTALAFLLVAGFLGNLLFLTMVQADAEEMKHVWESRRRMKVLQLALRQHRMEKGVYPQDAAQLGDYLRPRMKSISLCRSFGSFNVIDNVDTLFHESGTASRFVVVITRAADNYQIRSSRPTDYIGSWTNQSEFDRAMWE